MTQAMSLCYRVITGVTTDSRALYNIAWLAVAREVGVNQRRECFIVGLGPSSVRRFDGSDIVYGFGEDLPEPARLVEVF